ncbi:MAG: peptide-methionine (S)-S-oxide reductase MsrA [Parafilimonas sp.]
MKFFYSVILTMITVVSFAQNKTSIVFDHISSDDYKNYSVATFAAGCFWHEEALFESIKGVKEAVSGYAGGTTENPTYESVRTGTTGYAESVMVYYDPKLVSYATLVEVFFAGQNPTQVNGQGMDHGTQYRSIAFFRTPFEKQVIDNQIRAINLSGKYKARVETQVMQFTKFWVAEDYHQDYIEKNLNKSVADYIHIISIPAIKKFQNQYPQLLKPDHIF